MANDEYALVCALIQGSDEAFLQLYSRFKTRVYAFIYQMVSSQDVAQEIFQDVFVKLWENRAHIDPEQSFNAYLYTIARNSVYSFWRKCLNRRKLEQYLNTGGEVVSLQSENSVADRDYWVYIRSIIDHLPQRCKEVFILKHFHNKSYKEISRRFGISEKTVDNQIQKAKGLIRKQIQSEQLILLLPVLCALAGIGE